MPKRRELKNTWSSQDRERHLEDLRHHPYGHLRIRAVHHAWHKPIPGHRHTPHTHPHGVELGPHTNPPGPIRFSKKIQISGKTRVSLR